MLSLIGLGLNEKGFSREAYSAIRKADKVYLEGYTVDFPYDVSKLEKEFDKKVEILGRDGVESADLIKESKKSKIALLIYGSPLFATTHMTLISDAKAAKVPVTVIYGASVFDALGSTGLQLYKFGKIASMPSWTPNYKPDSFMDIVKDNQKIKAHSLILIDIGLSLSEALKQLKLAAKHKKIELDKIILCSQMGTSKQKVYYDNLKKLSEKKKTKLPFCLIIPSDMHFTEEEALKTI